MILATTNQVRRSSYIDVVKMIEIYKDLDILGIQTYVISNFTTVFINKRPYSQSMMNKIVIVGCSSDYTNFVPNRLGIRPLVYEYSRKVANHIRLNF